MMKYLNCGACILACFLSTTLFAQSSSGDSKKQRLDFAKTYLELGGSLMPSFQGKKWVDGRVETFDHSASVGQYLTWGGFHFWGHAEFYVTIPLSTYKFNTDGENDFNLIHSVATGARYYPWVAQNNKLRPYIGINWGALDFQQLFEGEEKATAYSKDFMINVEAGMTYNLKNLGMRLGLNYFPDNEWKYPISKTEKADIITPSLALQMGLYYSFDASQSSKHKDKDSWNDFPQTSKLSYKARGLGNFFVGIGPSSSFSLVGSDYNREELPYLKDRLVSNPYFDISLGYQFNQADWFTALSFRNPTFRTEGFGDQQEIKKTSLALEVNKFIIDFNGFAPYVGVNLAYEKLRYSEEINGITQELELNHRLEPGLTIGWDIVPGKTSEALILRTNLRWYPWSSFEVEGNSFQFSQLEYNLIQAVFYPGRLRHKN